MVSQRIPVKNIDVHEPQRPAYGVAAAIPGFPGSPQQSAPPAQQPRQLSRKLVLIALAVTLVAAGGVGLAVGMGIGQTAILMGVLAPFAIMLLLARPQWAAVVYIGLVYTDLLSILVRYHDFPALARFAGVAVVTATLGYRLFVQRQPLAKDKITVWLLAYGAMVAVGVLYARAPDLVVTEVIEFVRCFFTYLIIINIITTSGRLHAALYTLMGAAVFLATLTLVQSLTGTFDNDFGGLAQYRVSDIAGDSEGARPGGTIGDANYYGQLLVIMIPVALYLLFEGRRRLAKFTGLICSVILIAAVIFTYSRGDALALGAVIVAGVIYVRPNPLILTGGVIALALAIPFLPSNYLARITTIVGAAQGNEMTITGDDSLLGRTGATIAAIEMFEDHPFFGVGRENYPSYQLDYLAGTPYAKVAKGIPPHNLYLEVAAENGIMGLLVFGGLLLVSWLALLDARKRFKLVQAQKEYQLTGWLAIVFIGYLVTAIFLHGAFLYILWMVISLIAAIRQIAVSYTPAMSRPAVQIQTMTFPQPATALPGRVARRRLALPAVASQNAPPIASEAASAAMPNTYAEPQIPFSKPAPNFAGRPAPFRSKMSKMDTSLMADLETWLAAGEMALQRGDYDVARAMVELALERDLYNKIAWEIGMKVRLVEGGWATDAGGMSAGDVEQAAGGSQPRHLINDKLYNFWHVNGGVPIFGYPISPRFFEVSGAGEMIEVQYFERARLEFHPALAGTDDDVQTGAVGREVEITGTPAGLLPNGLEGEQVIFTVDGVQISMPRIFFNFWEANGGPDIMGMPFTQVLVDRNNNGRAIWVQYFSKARLEYNPEMAGTVYEVQLSQLGAAVFRSKYGYNQ